MQMCNILQSGQDLLFSCNQHYPLYRMLNEKQSMMKVFWGSGVILGRCSQNSHVEWFGRLEHHDKGVADLISTV